MLSMNGRGMLRLAIWGHFEHLGTGMICRDECPVAGGVQLCGKDSQTRTLGLLWVRTLSALVMESVGDFLNDAETARYADVGALISRVQSACVQG